MIDKNIISSTIRALERVIGILENCKDTNEMSEATRRRIVEMLNTSMLNTAFITQNNESVTVVDNNTISENDIIIEDKPANIIELPISSQPLVEFDTSASEKDAEERAKAEEAEANRIAEVRRLDAEKKEAEEKARVEAEERARIEEIGRQKREEEEKARAEAEAESIRIAEEERLEREKHEKEIEAKNNKLQQQQLELAKLQEQLENERKRLEDELKSWNSEKQKKEEEALLKALELEKQKMDGSKKDQSVFEAFAPQTGVKVEAPVIKEEIVVKQEPIKVATPEPVKQEDKKESLINKFLGTKKVVNETFEYESISTQGLTPIAQLSKAIGINDKFQFIKELFGGDADLYIETIEALNNIGSFESAIDYIKSNFSWDDKNPTIKAFVTLLKRRYM